MKRVGPSVMSALRLQPGSASSTSALGDGESVVREERGGSLGTVDVRAWPNCAVQQLHWVGLCVCQGLPFLALSPLRLHCSTGRVTASQDEFLEL